MKVPSRSQRPRFGSDEVGLAYSGRKMSELITRRKRVGIEV